LKKVGHRIEEHQKDSRNVDPIIYNIFYNIQNSCHKENKQEKSQTDDKWREHFFKDISIYN
jgi:hypothetical protein